MVLRWSETSSPLLGRAGALCLILLLLLFAGCAKPAADSGSSAPTGTATPGGPRPGPTTGLDAPIWAVGDHWTYTPTQGEATTFVVVDDTGTDWMIGTDSPDLAFFHAQEEVSTLGAQRKDDLAGSQGSQRVEFFRWPLTDGATWNTTWDRVERTITASEMDDRTWSFEAREGGNLTVRYTYDPDVRWFTTLEFLRGDQAAFGWQLTGHGTNWTGQTYIWDLQDVVSFAQPSTIAFSTQPTSFEVPADATDVWASFAVGCTTGAIIAGVHPVPWDPDAAGARWHEPCTGPWSFAGSLGHTAGTWNADFVWQGGSPGTVSGTVYVRTLRALPFG